jgi:hypothetical protein
MVLLDELHMNDQEKFVYTCNMCSEIVEMRYHCTICNDYDLCLKCFIQNGHRHKMEKQEFDHDGSDFSNKFNQNCENLITRPIQNPAQAGVNKILSSINDQMSECRISLEGSCRTCQNILSMYRYLEEVPVMKLFKPVLQQVTDLEKESVDQDASKSCIKTVE